MQSPAARLIEHGQPLQVQQVTLADPADDEVLVDMAFSGVNPIDRYGALGRVAPNGPLPRTLGGEGSGRVDGRPVLVRGHGLGTTRDGLWTSLAVVPAAAVVEVPDGVELEAAAAIGVAGLTAWRVVTELARVTADDRVLVLGASGGVGSTAVSVASALGATVWGQTTDQGKADWIRQRGAQRAVVADAHSLAASAAELRPTVVIDPLGDGYTGAALEALEARGRLVIFGTSADANGTLPLQTLYRKGLTIYGYAGLMDSDAVLAGHVVEALHALRDGRLQVSIDRVLPLSRVNEAFDLLAQQKVQGKVLLDLGS